MLSTDGDPSLFCGGLRISGGAQELLTMLAAGVDIMEGRIRVLDQNNPS